MKYAIIGAGGTGGSLGFFLTKAGKDVTLIARGKHLEAIRKNGLCMLLPESFLFYDPTGVPCPDHFF